MGNLCAQRKARMIYHSLLPRERVGMTPERLAQLLIDRNN